MAMRVIEVIVSKDDVDHILRVARGPEVVDVWCIPGAEPGQMVLRVLAPMTQCQALIDKFHGILSDNKHRIVLIPTLAVIPEPEEPEQTPPEQPKSSTAAREELYNTVAEGTKVDNTFLLLIVLSTLVAGRWPRAGGRQRGRGHRRDGDCTFARPQPRFRFRRRARRSSPDGARPARKRDRAELGDRRFNPRRPGGADQSQ
jgi:hypothetical protein